MTPGEKDWQPVKLERNRENGVVYFGDSLSDHPDYEVETFVPISSVRERLLSKEAVDLMTDAFCPFSGEALEAIREESPQRIEMYRPLAVRSLEALAAAFLREEEGPCKTCGGERFLPPEASLHGGQRPARRCSDCKEEEG